MKHNVEQELRERIAQLEQQVSDLRKQNGELLSQLDWHESASTTNTAIATVVTVLP